MNPVVVSLLYIGIMLVAAKLMEAGFSRLGLTPFVGAIVAGIILGRGVLGIIELNSIISFVTSLGIVFLLFLAGAEEFGGEIQFDYKVFISSIVLLVIPFIVIAGYLFMVHVTSSLVILFPLIMTSVGPLTRLLMDTGLVKTDVGRKLFYQGTLVEIISVILFAIVSKSSEPAQIVRQTLEIVILFLIIIFIGPRIAKALEGIEGFIKVREVELAFLLSVIMVTGYVAEIFGFNSAIAALFLGFLLRNYLEDRPDLREKMHGLTYGFFEPLFFVSIGLYFAPLNVYIASIGLTLALLVFFSKFVSGYISSYLVKQEGVINGLGVTTKGGVDSSLLISALVSGYLGQTQYSYSALAITLIALVVPLLFKAKVKGVGREIENRPGFNQKLGHLPGITPLYVNAETTLRETINRMTERGARAIIVVDDEMRPMGHITVQQLLEIDPSMYSVLRVGDLELNETVIMDESQRVIDALRKFRSTESAVIAVVNREGKLVQTIYERELLRILNSI